MNFILGFAVLKTLKPALLVTVVGFTSVLLWQWVLLAFLLPPFIPLLTHFKAQTLWNIIRAAMACAVGNVHWSQLTQEASWERWFSLTVALNLAAVDGRGSAEGCQLDSPAQDHAEIVDLCLLLEDDISGLCFCSSAEWISRLCVPLKWSVDVI